MPEFLNKGDIASWGNDQFWLFPNLSIQIWARNYYITYTYWPEAVDSHIYEIDMYFVPPANAHERLAQELVVDSTIEFAMQDVNTIEATHSALATRAQQQFHLSDQELLIRSFHKVIRDTVAAYQRATRGGVMPTTSRAARAASPSSSRTSTTGPSPTRAERYATRLSKSIDELAEFYDAIAPRAEEAIEYLERLDLDDAARRRHPAAPAPLLDDPRLVRGEHLQAAAHPRLGRGVLRHGRRAGGLSRCVDWFTSFGRWWVEELLKWGMTRAAPTRPGRSGRDPSHAGCCKWAGSRMTMRRG